MLISEIVNIVNGTVERNYKDSKIKKIRINSREVKKDDIFICLKGKYKNGNDYILESIKNKAKAEIKRFAERVYKINSKFYKVMSGKEDITLLTAEWNT